MEGDRLAILIGRVLQAKTFDFSRYDPFDPLSVGSLLTACREQEDQLHIAHIQRRAQTAVSQALIPCEIDINFRQQELEKLKRYLDGIDQIELPWLFSKSAVTTTKTESLVDAWHKAWGADLNDPEMQRRMEKTVAWLNKTASG